MELRRFFVSPSAVQDGKIIIENEEFFHLKNVLRMKIGFKVIVCLNDGFDIYGTIEKIEKDFAVVSIDEKIQREMLSHKITLFPALLKNNKLDFVIQKAVELGVAEIFPYTNQNTSETKFNVERANRIALEAGKQCGSADLTIVHDVLSFDEVLKMFSNFDCVVLPYEDEMMKSFKECNFNGQNYALVIGSEGGFCKSEIDLAKENGAEIVTLGKRILRADTASIVSVALLQNELGELER